MCEMSSKKKLVEYCYNVSPFIFNIHGCPQQPLNAMVPNIFYSQSSILDINLVVNKCWIKNKCSGPAYLTLCWSKLRDEGLEK